ncbi:MAG TPA: phosphatase PAP2 family protein [Miltoncostaeaceae bacterium]|nr:phosphatase PAP2 family protein [Miltoncostaeaceae bacterium]
MSPRRAPSSSIAAALAGLAAAAALGVALVYLLAVRTAEGRRLDDAAKGDLREGSRAFEETSDLLDTISVSSLATLGVAIMAVALLRGRPRLALGAGAILLGANLTTQYLKAELGRPGTFGPDGGSYPSGHVTVAMSLAMALVLVVPPALRPVATLVGAAYAVGVGVAVIALDWHRPSDVVGAYLVTVAWAALVAAVLAAGPGAGELRARHPASRRAVRAGGAVAVALALGFGAVVAAEAGSRLDLVAVVDDRTAFAAASAVCAAVCATLAALVAGLVQRTAR